MSSNDSITITLTDARPLRVNKTLWPLVAKASEDRDHNNQELNRRYHLRVRQHTVRVPYGHESEIEYYGGDKVEDYSLAAHPDGRVVVYGWSESNWQEEHGSQAGYVTTLDEAAAIIRNVGNEIQAPDYLITECISDLPPTDESDESVDLVDALTTEQLESALAKRKQAK